MSNPLPKSMNYELSKKNIIYVRFTFVYMFVFIKTIYGVYMWFLCHFRTTATNGSKLFLNFSDFPFPDDWPLFLPHFKVQEYLENYAQHFSLHTHINFQHEVVQISKSEDFQRNGKWIIKVRNGLTGELKEEVYDAVMVCAGLHKKKTLPKVCFT